MWERIKDVVQSMLQGVMNHVPTVIGALGFFILGWFASKFISKSIGLLLKKIKLDEGLSKKSEETPVKIEGVIVKLIYYLLLIVVLLITLELLGVHNVLEPLEAMVQEFLEVVPNIVKAGFIVFFGYILAKIVASIVRAAAATIDPIAPKAGFGKSFSLSKVLEQLVFIIIFLMTATVALEVLEIQSISKPAEAILNELGESIPNILGAAIVVFVSYIVGRFVMSFLSELLKDLGADEIPKKIGAAGIFGKKSFSKFCAGIVFLFIMLGAITSAVEILNIDVITESLGGLLEFAGNIVVGLIILGVGSFIANFRI